MSQPSDSENQSEATETSSPTRTSCDSVMKWRQEWWDSPRPLVLERHRRLEAQRLKEQLSSVPYHQEQVARVGERWWQTLAQSYNPGPEVVDREVAMLTARDKATPDKT